MMERLLQSLARIAAFVRRDRHDRDFDAELDAHLDLAVEELMRKGLSRSEARRRALGNLGGRAAATELHRDTRGLPWADRWLQDLRGAGRSVRRAPLFSLVAVFVLALGIGANTAVFSLVDAVLFKPLPFRDADRLVWIENRYPGSAASGLSGRTTRIFVYEEWTLRARSVEDLAGYHAFFGYDTQEMIGAGEPERLTGVAVTSNFFDFLGITPAAGRSFRSADAAPDGAPVVMLSHQFWTRRFGADPAVVGLSLTIDGQPTTVVGVTPARFSFGDTFTPGSHIDLFRPLVFDSARQQGNVLSVIGRLAPGASIASAQAEFDQIVAKMKTDFPADGESYGAAIGDLREHVSGGVRASLGVLWASVAVVLLAVCANLANLLLARASTRRREMAVRAALGAGRARLMRQLLTEVGLLVSAGAAAGTALAYGLVTSIASSQTIDVPLLASARLDFAALVFTLLVALVSAMLFGLIPAVQVSSTRLTDAVREDGRGTAGSRRQRTTRNVLVVAEVALAAMLAVGAVLLLRSMDRVLAVDAGFEPERAAIVSLDGGGRGDTPTDRAFFYLEAMDRVRAVPGVTAAGLSDTVPLSRNYTWGVRRPGQQLEPGESQGAFVRRISPGYLEAMGIDLIDGRDFARSDDRQGERVAIVNQSLADRLWPGEDPLDKTLVSVGTEWRVVGLAPDVRHLSLEERSGMELYLSLMQTTPGSLDLVIRSGRPLDQLATDVRSALRALDPTLPVTDYRPMTTLVDRSLSTRRFMIALIGGFTLVALLLSAVGIYGVVSHTVGQRIPEIGIRLALGATGMGVLRQVLGATIRLALVGVGVGLAAALAAGPWLASMLFGVSARDPLTFAAVAVGLVTLAAAAGILPAWRASRVSPVTALRENGA